MNVALPAKDAKVHESLMPERMFKKECYSIVGACFEVYKANGNGNGMVFLSRSNGNALNQECPEIELDCQNIPFESQKELLLTFRGQN